MFTKKLLSQAIDNLPYSIKPDSYSSFKQKLMNNATEITFDGKFVYEVIYDTLTELCNKLSYKPTEKELIDCTFITIYFLSTDIKCEIEFKMEKTPLSEKCSDMIIGLYCR